MTPQLKALLAVVGIVGAGIVVYTSQPGVTLTDLQSAGIEACATRERDCLVRDEPGGADICPGGQRYCRKTIAIKVCNEADGGKAVIMRPAHVRLIADDGAWCGPARASALAEGTAQDVPFECACPMSSACKLIDGGTAPQGNTLAAGMFTPSAACLPKPCVGMFVAGGDETWDPGCPQ
jgi:hypothetical protein